MQREAGMENCPQSNDTVQDGVLLFQTVVYIPVLAFGVLLNAIAFWVFCCKLKRWTETRVYMINLMVADCFLLFALPFLIYFHREEHPTGKLCFTIQCIYFTNRPMSILIVTMIAIDRYIAIKFPLKAKTLRSPLKSAAVCGLLWIILLTYAYFHPEFEEGKEQFCFQKRTSQPKYSSLLSICFGFFIPLGIVVFCSVEVIKCLKKKMSSSSHETKLIQKALHIISVNLCVFILCFLPLYAVLLLRFVVDLAGACSLISKVRVSIQIFACLANANCCLDGFCYYFAAKEFQETSSLLHPCMFLRSRMNQSQESQQPTDQVVT